MAGPAFYRTLRIGSKGPDVAAVKTALRAWRTGIIGNVTEVYGDGAVVAVKAFQKYHGIPQTGVYGPKTHDALVGFFTHEARALYDSARPVPKPTLVRPITKAQSLGIVNGAPSASATGPTGGIHETDGLAGYPALDFLGHAGAEVVAPEQGVIERFSGHDPSGGPVSGIHGPFGWSLYLLGKSGTDYFVTHLGSRFCTIGQTVACGQKIGTVADYARWGGTNHAHVGAKSTGSYYAAIRRLGNAPLL